MAHYWNFVQDKYGDSYYMYEKRAIEPVRTFFGARSKIYRQTFSLNRDMQAGKGESWKMYGPVSVILVHRMSLVCTAVRIPMIL